MNDNNNDIKNVSDFVNAIVTKTKKLENKESTQNVFWFRGEGSNKWKNPLVPKIYRVLAESLYKNDCFISETVKQVEGNMKADFYRKAAPFIATKKIENTSWNQYFMMQHYKISTRLLDWTESALIALFFAISDANLINDDAVVWILNPFNLNNYTLQKITGINKNFNKISFGEDSENTQSLFNDINEIRINELTRRYLFMDFKSRKEENLKDIYYPYAIYPQFLDERMSAQQSCFTVFGNKVKGLLSIDEDCKNTILDSIQISNKNKPNILNELKLLGINFNSIYPDLDGIGQTINSNFGKGLFNNIETLNHVLLDIGKAKENND